ncbi:MAG: TIM barrel protein [Spirochaeta sp.]|jgi:2-keto-myo-inositol isomerase|nr:TIM barrel protein [Spirochaeta sp.]
MENMQFGVNRMVAPSLDLAAFFDLTAAVGGVGVELRNDLAGFDVIDSMDAAEVRDRLGRHGLRVLTINAVQHFNLPSAAGDATTELKRLSGYARELGNPAIVMCPHCDAGDTRSRTEMARDTRETLQQYRPILEDAGVIGLVEPLGFPESSLRDPALAAEIIGEIGSDTFQLTLDTFHFAVAGMDPSVLGSAAVPAELIGIVHISGVTKAGPVAEFRDPDRVYVDADDRVGNVESLQKIRAAGYRGSASFEPFSPSVHDLSVTAMRNAITGSINYINKSL